MTSHYGIVENSNDSTHIDGKKLGRCQVRVFGKHSENKTNENTDDYLPTNLLPWFEVMLPVTSAGQQQNIDTPFLKNGSTVIIDYLDSDEQYGIIRGVLLRQPTTLPDTTKGFSDPNEEYPTNDDLNKSPLYPYVTGDVNDVVQNKLDNIETSTLGFTEPATPYAPVYGQNKVISTKNHIIELDDTDGIERVHIYHKSGTFEEIHPDGTRVKKIMVDDYKIIIGTSNTKVNEVMNIEVVGNINLKTQANSNVIIEGNSDITITGANNITSSGNTTITSPKTTLTGDIVVIDGTVAPTGTGALCGIPFCLFTNAPQTGPETTGS